MKLPAIVGGATEEKLGRLFEVWWSERGLDDFIDFLEEIGQPVIDDRDEDVIVDEAQLMTNKNRHDQFLKEVEDC